MESETIPAGQAVTAVAALLAVIAILWIASWVTITRGWLLARRAVPYVAGSGAARRARPVRHWVRDRYPRFYGFLAARFDPGRFDGLPLTLIAAAAAYIAFLFAGLVEEVIESEEITAVDHAIFDAVAAYRHPALVTAFVWITELGSMATLTAVAIVSTGFLWSHGPQIYIGPVWLTVIGAQLTTWGGKFIIDRPRPEFVLNVTAYSPSFPSGHTTGAMAVYGILAYAIARDLATPRQRFEIVFWSGVLIALIALSRIFINVHYASDVAAGLMVGTFWLMAGIALAEILRRRDPAPPGARGPDPEARS